MGNERHPTVDWWLRFDAWVERAILQALPPRQRRLLGHLFTLCSVASVGLAFLVPCSASLTLMLPLLMGCFLKGRRWAWLLPPMAVLHFLLLWSPAGTAVFLAGGGLTILFSLVTASKFRAVREHGEHLVHQGDRLRLQSEELRRQSGELRLQGEELRHQGDELRHQRDELRRQRDELRRQGDELRQSLAVARQVQQALEPPPREEWGLLEMASTLDCPETLGGDFVCLKPVGPDRYGVMLGDVMGKGVRAALAAAYVTGLYSELAREGFSPSAILEITNRQLCELFGQFELFVTIAAVEYDPKRDEWRVAVAGHEPPLLLRADGRCEQLTERGMAAGIELNEHYHDMRRPAAPGDQIFMASDGLIPEGLPEEAVQALLMSSLSEPPVEALERTVEHLRSTLPKHHRDDRTAVLVRRIVE